jgi:tRNA A-37 threonylcarbamoyl transferase component Bud32
MAFDGSKFIRGTPFVESHSCPEFDRWLKLRTSDLRVDFRRIERVGSGLHCLKDYIVNLAGFEKELKIDESDGVRKAIYHRVEDQFVIFLKSIARSENVPKSRMENEIENLINLRHPCITGPIGFIFGTEPGSQQELKVVRLYLEGCSLAEVLSVVPVWWTSTLKAKVVAGIVLSLRFVHSHGLLHGGLTTNNILFDAIIAFKLLISKEWDCKMLKAKTKVKVKKERNSGDFRGKNGHLRRIFLRLH